MDEKYLLPIESLREWDQNPRNINKKDYERLKTQLELLGQYAPLLCMEDGVVLGGNMRLRALRELGKSRVWVTNIIFLEDDQGLWSAKINGVVSPKKFQTKEDGMLEYALSSNDRAGFYDEDLLANMEGNFTIDWDQYAIDLTEPLTLAEMLDDPDKSETNNFAKDPQEIECPKCQFKFTP